jgi:hypothetical protein
MNEPATMVGYGQAQYLFPLPIGQVTIAKSQDEFGIQLADVCASALKFILSPRNDKYTQQQDKLRQLPLFQIIDGCIAPLTPDELVKRTKDVDGIAPLDFLCNHLGN